MIFSKLFKTKPAYPEEVQTLYINLVKQSRIPDFFTELEVADTVEGRFDMIALHAFLVLRKLKEGEEKTEKFAQSLYDLMFADMDQNLRELGIGDMGLAKRVPKMAEALYGRIAAYEEGLAADDNDETLKAALDRNLYRKQPVSDESLAKMARYLRASIQKMDENTIEDLLKGQVSFCEAPTKND